MDDVPRRTLPPHAGHGAGRAATLRGTAVPILPRRVAKSCKACSSDGGRRSGNRPRSGLGAASVAPSFDSEGTHMSYQSPEITELGSVSDLTGTGRRGKGPKKGPKGPKRPKMS